MCAMFHVTGTKKTVEGAAASIVGKLIAVVILSYIGECAHMCAYSEIQTAAYVQGPPDCRDCALQAGPVPPH